MFINLLGRNVFNIIWIKVAPSPTIQRLRIAPTEVNSSLRYLFLCRRVSLQRNENTTHRRRPRYLRAAETEVSSVAHDNSQTILAVGDPRVKNHPVRSPRNKKIEILLLFLACRASSPNKAKARVTILLYSRAPLLIFSCILSLKLASYNAQHSSQPPFQKLLSLILLTKVERLSLSPSGSVWPYGL